MLCPGVDPGRVPRQMRLRLVATGTFKSPWTISHISHRLQASLSTTLARARSLCTAMSSIALSACGILIRWLLSCIPGTGGYVLERSLGVPQHPQHAAKCKWAEAAVVIFRMTQ